MHRAITARRVAGPSPATESMVPRCLMMLYHMLLVKSTINPYINRHRFIGMATDLAVQYPIIVSFRMLNVKAFIYGLAELSASWNVR